MPAGRPALGYAEPALSEPALSEPAWQGDNVDAVTLCAGTMLVEHPEQVLLDYLDPRNGYAYPAYDTLATNGSAQLVDGDLLAPVLIGTEVDRGRYRLLRDLVPHLRGVAELPDVALQDADDATLDRVADLFAVLDRAPYAGRGVRGTIISKVLHRKRPDLVPLYDSRIYESYTAPGALPRSQHRSWQEFMGLLCRQMRADLQAEADGFRALQQVAAETGASLTRLRILDVLVWRTAGTWH